ncbi:MAG: GAF domain-containing protein [Bdellovibrionales bacterium]|nr:GAF domain-containing protein [Bdellovibrionales bacterium]
MSLDYNLTKQHFNVKIYKSYLQYIEKRYPEINLSNVCEKAGVPIDYLLKSDGWVSIEFNNRFMTELKSHIQDPNFEQRVGESSFSKEIMGPIYFLMKNVISLEEIFNNIWKFPKYFNKVTSFTAIKRNKGTVVISIKGVTQDLNLQEIEILKKSMPDIINNSLGFYYGFAKAKKFSAVAISTTQINDLEYQIKIRYPIEKIGLIRELATLFFVSCFAGIFTSFLTSNVYELAAYSILPALIMKCYLVIRQNKFMVEAINESEKTLNNLDKQYKTLVDTKLVLQRKLSEAKALNQLTNTLIQTSSESQILQSAAENLTSVLDFDRVLIMISDKANKYLEVRAVSVSDNSLVEKFKNFKLPIDIESNDKTKVSNIYKFGSPILISDVKKHISTLGEESRMLLQQTGSKSFVGVPIQSATNNHGVILADTFYTEREITNDDLDILALAGRQIAITLEKQKAQAEVVMAYDDLNKLAKSYSRFVPFKILNLLGFESVLDIDLKSGKEVNMAIVFCDIRGFTSLSETMEPSESMDFLNSYFSSLAPIFERNKGIIDKFMGDGIMALFLDTNDAINAVSEFQGALELYNLKRKKSDEQLSIKTGMGIHFGKVLLGAVGYEDRMSISVVSDAVNLTSRLDGLTKKFGIDIVCSQDAFNLANDKSNFRLIAELAVDGRRGLTSVYEYFGHENCDTRRMKQSNKEIIERFIRNKLISLDSATNLHEEDPVLRYYFNKNFSRAA